MKNKDTGEMPSNSFTKLLIDHRKGECLNELSRETRGLIQQIVATGGKGEIVLKLKFKPDGDGTTIVVADDITVKMPKPTKHATILFATEEGNLQKNDPNQAEMVLAEVPAAEADVRTLQEAPAPVRKVG